MLISSGELVFFSKFAAVSNFSPLPHFVPLVEFKDRIDHWKWIGEIFDVTMLLFFVYDGHTPMPWSLLRFPAKL